MSGITGIVLKIQTVSARMGRRMLAVAELEAKSVSIVVIMQMTSRRANGGSVFKFVKLFPINIDSPDFLEASAKTNPAPVIWNFKYLHSIHSSVWKKIFKKSDPWLEKGPMEVFLEYISSREGPRNQVGIVVL